jgi:hypothetical protein
MLREGLTFFAKRPKNRLLHDHSRMTRGTNFMLIGSTTN